MGALMLPRLWNHHFCMLRRVALCFISLQTHDVEEEVPSKGQPMMVSTLLGDVKVIHE